MRRIGLSLVVLTITVSGLAPAVARGGFHGRGPGPGPGERLERMLDRLELEASQKEEVFGIVERYHEGVLGETAEELRQAHKQLREAIHDPDAGEQQVLEASRVVSARSEQMALERHRMFVEISRVLTPDQQAALQEMIEEHGGPRRTRDRPSGPGR